MKDKKTINKPKVKATTKPEVKTGIKTATITVKIDSELKDNVEQVLNRLGLNHSSVIQVLYNQIELTNGLPFNISIPDKQIKRTVKNAK